MLLEPIIFISSTYCAWLFCCGDYLRGVYEYPQKN